MCCFDSSLLFVAIFQGLCGSSSSPDGLSCGKRKAMENLFKGKLATASESATAGTIHPAPCPDTN